MALRWYVIEAHEGSEGKVCRMLLAARFVAWRPVALVTKLIRAPGKPPVVRRVREARFGSYLFLHANEHQMQSGWLLSEILNMPGVLLVVREAGSDRPAPMPEGLVEFYKNSQPTEIDADCPKISEGCKVEIVSGPLTGRLGVVARVDRERVLRLSILDTEGRPTPATCVCEIGHVALRELCRRQPKQATSRKAA